MSYIDDSRKIPLAQLPNGEKAVVADLNGGRKMVCRVISMGFCPGAVVTMIQNFQRGSLIVQVRDARIALGRGEAQKIMIVPFPHS